MDDGKPDCASFVQNITSREINNRKAYLVCNTYNL